MCQKFAIEMIVTKGSAVFATHNRSFSSSCTLVEIIILDHLYFLSVVTIENRVHRLAPPIALAPPTPSLKQKNIKDG
jgi:hypothetical protein